MVLEKIVMPRIGQHFFWNYGTRFIGKEAMVKIKELHKNHNISQVQLAIRFDTSTATIRKVLRGTYNPKQIITYYSRR